MLKDTLNTTHTVSINDDPQEIEVTFRRDGERDTHTVIVLCQYHMQARYIVHKTFDNIHILKTERIER